MRKILGIGETVLDIVLKGNQTIGALPGGSVFNAMISLGRCGMNSTLISDIGMDKGSDLVVAFMQENGVSTDYMNRNQDYKVPLSLAFLNDNNDASYSFYHVKVDGLFDEFTMPEINADDIILIGSFYAVDPHSHEKVKSILEYAQAQGAIIYYDVNYRPSHQNDKVRVMPNIMDILEYADIVRGSSDDFNVLYNLRDADKIYKREISFYCQNFIYTDSCNATIVFGANSFKGEYPTKEVETVSTIGAGDNFNAGLIYELVTLGITREQLTEGLSAEQWNSLIASAQAFATNCCGSIYNYVSVEFGKKR